MANQRPKQSTIPEGRNPIANSNFTQTQPPINQLIANTSEPVKPEALAENGAEPVTKPMEDKPSKPTKGKVTVVVAGDVLERLRNAAYWQREPLAAIAEEGLRLVLAKMERENGGPFEPMKKKLKRGRPQGSKNAQ